MELKKMVEEYQRRKSQLEQCKIMLAETESDIIRLVGTKPEGTTTIKEENFKVSVSCKLNRSIDYDAYLKVRDSLPENLRPISYKPEIDLKILRALEIIDPSIPATFITTKPAKPSVKVEVL